MKRLFLIIMSMLMNLTACSANVIYTEAPQDSGQVVVTDTPNPTPPPTPEPTPLPAETVWDEDVTKNTGEIYRCCYGINNDYGHMSSIIRVEVMSDGTGVLRLVTGTLDYSVFNSEFTVVDDVRRDLSKERIDVLLRILEETDFWNLGDYPGKFNPANPPTWLSFDGLKGGEYHMVYRGFSPVEAYADTRELFEYFIDLCGETEYDLHLPTGYGD